MPQWSDYHYQTTYTSFSTHSAPKPSSSSGPVFAGNYPLPFPTPPSSVPTSAPGSPETYRTTIGGAQTYSLVQALAGYAAMASTVPAPVGSRRRKKRIESGAVPRRLADFVEVDAESGAPFRSISPPLNPNVLFSSSMADEPAVARGKSSSRSRQGGSARSDSQKRSLHSSTSTTTTRKMERRQVRYSFPGLDRVVAPGPALAGPRRPRSPSTGSSRARSPSGSNRKTTTPQSSRSTRRTSSAKYEPHAAPPAPRQQRWRAASYSTPATSSPFFRRSSSASSYAIQRRQSTANGGRDEFALTTVGSAPLLRPLVNALAFLVVTAVAAVTISAVLATSFSLTFYDDCSRRVGYVQRSLGGSIEGVRAGMGRMLGNARGALDLAVRVAGGSKVAAVHCTMDGESADHRRTTMPAVPQEQEPELEQDDIGSIGIRQSRPKRTRSTSAQAESPYAPTPLTSKRRKPGAREPRPPPSFTPARSPGKVSPSFASYEVDADEHSPGAATPGWRTDDDDGASLPFRVPPSTPRSSRAVSPHREERRSSGGPRTSALPPRPPLAFLIPSIVLALLFTLGKVLLQAWKGHKHPSSFPRARP